MGGKSKSTQKTNTVSDPWKPSQPALNQSLGIIGGYLNSPNATSVYQGPRVAQMSDATQQGIEGMTNAAGGQLSSDYLTRVVNGDYLNAGNPNLQALQDSIRASVMPSVNSTFSNAGMVGSTAHQGLLAKALTQGMAAPMFQNYENERARQMQAAQFLPQLEANIAQNQITAGQIGEGYEQRNLDADRQLWEENRAAPIRGLSEVFPYLQGIAGLGGQQQGTTTTSQKTPLGQQILGGAMMGASLLGGNPMGMIGTGLGNVAQGAPWTYGSSWAPWVRAA
jgi:hypothetical protein